MTKEMKNRMLILALVGYIMGMMLGAFINVFAGDPSWIADNKWFFMAQLFGSGLLGAFNMAGTIVYDIEDWGLTRATVTHYALALGAFLVANFTLGWFPMEIMLYVFIMFTIAYFIIWLIMFLKFKREIRLMNQELKEMLAKEKEGTQV